MRKAYIIDAIRTLRGRGQWSTGALTVVHRQDLLGQTLNALAEPTGVEPGDAEDVVIRCVGRTGEQGANVARQAVLLADWPLHVTGVTLNRCCGSGSRR